MLAKHLAHPVVIDRLAGLPGQVQNQVLRNCMEDPVQVCGDLALVTDYHLEKVAKALQPLLAGPTSPCILP